MCFKFCVAVIETSMFFEFIFIKYIFALKIIPVRPAPPHVALNNSIFFLPEHLTIFPLGVIRVSSFKYFVKVPSL